MRCEAMVRHPGDRSLLCEKGCPAMFKIQFGPLRGQWVWLCDHHLEEYRENGMVAMAGPPLDPPKPIEFESTSKIRKNLLRQQALTPVPGAAVPQELPQDVSKKTRS
jgi:hypothetical protein